MSKNAVVRYTPQPTSIVRSSSRAEQKSAVITQGQLKAMQYEQIKAHYAAQALEDISTARMELFEQGASAIWDIKNQPGRSTDLQDIINQTAVNTTLRLDSYLQKSTDIGAGQIISIQQIPTHQEPEFKPERWYNRKLRDA